MKNKLEVSTMKQKQCMTIWTWLMMALFLNVGLFAQSLDDLLGQMAEKALQVEEEEKAVQEELEVNLDDVPAFLPGNENQGVYPDISVLEDPLNPFRTADVGTLEGKKWGYVASSDPESDFYLWATLLALTGTGEAQFYTALALQNANLDEHAIRAYQSVLDYFPEAMSYTADGTGWSVAAASKANIRELGGTPQIKVQKPFEIAGGVYDGWMVSKSAGGADYAPWSIGQRHSFEMRMDLQPVPFLHGFVTTRIEGARPIDVMLVPSTDDQGNDVLGKNATYSADASVGEEVHYGTYVKQVDLRMDTGWMEAQLYKGVAINDWGLIYEIHPRWWDLSESVGRGWGYPSGFRVTEKVLPFDTRVTFEAGPAPADIASQNAYFLKATPQFGPVKTVLARRHHIVDQFEDDSEITTYERSINAIDARDVAVDTAYVEYTQWIFDISGQVAMNWWDERMFYSNGNLLDGVGEKPQFGDRMTYAARVEVNENGNWRGPRPLPVHGFASFTYSGAWANNYVGGKARFWAGPFQFIQAAVYGEYRKNLVEADFMYPVQVKPEHREGLIGDVAVTFDMTPGTLMRETWGDYNLTGWEDSPLAAELGFRYEAFSTWTDPLGSEWGGSIYPQPNGAYGLFPSTNGQIYGTVVANVDEWQLTADGKYGKKQSERGTEESVLGWTVFQEYGLSAKFRGRSELELRVKLDDWMDYMYDPLPETWSPKWGITADENYLVRATHSIKDTSVELAYENIASEELYGEEDYDRVHIISSRFTIGF